jgi:hypothetical protein
MAFIGGNTVPVDAQAITTPVDSQRITNSLYYPTSSQRFYKEGRDLFETEIQRLQQKSPTSASILCINPDILQPEHDRQKQQQTGVQPCCHQLKLNVDQGACY